MTRRSSAAILTLALLHAGTALAEEKAAAGPKLELPEAFFDFGVVARGERAAHEFTLRNAGDTPLEITHVFGDPTTTVTGPDPVIAPGASSKIQVELDTLRIIGPTSLRVRFSTNDPASPRTGVAMQVNVESSLKMVPGYARYVYVQGEEKGTIVQTLWATDDSDLEVVGVDNPYPFMDVTHREAKLEERKPEGKGRQWRIETTLRLDSPVGALREHLVIRLNHPRETMVLLPVTGFVRPIFVATPLAGDVGSLALAQPRRFRFHLKNFATETIEILGVETDVAGVEASFEPIEAGREYLVWVLFKPEMAKGEFSGRVQVRTGSPKVPVVDLPLRGTIVAPPPSAG